MKNSYSAKVSTKSQQAFYEDFDLGKQNENETAAAYKIFVDKISLPTKKDVRLFFQEKLIPTRMRLGSAVPGLISIVSFKQKICGGEKEGTPDTAVVHQEPRIRLSKRMRDLSFHILRIKYS